MLYIRTRLFTLIKLILIKKRKQKFAIAHYMNQRNITKSIGLKILKYLDYLNKKDMDNPQIGQDILGLVSPQLKEELYLDYFGKILRS